MSHATMLFLAVIAALLILMVVNGIAQIARNPDTGVEGLKCRLSIIASSRSEEVFQGMNKLSKSCSVIEKEIPLRGATGIYPLENEAKKPVDMSADEFRKVVIRDFTELIARAWWMTAEGDRSDYFLKKAKQIFTSDNKCMIVYAIRIHAPRKYASFQYITQADMDAALRTYKKSQAFNQVFENDMYIQDYISLSGTGGALFLKDNIELTHGGSDAIYGIAVGFATQDGLTSFAKGLFGNNAESVNPKSSFILIKRFDTLAEDCDVENK